MSTQGEASRSARRRPREGNDEGEGSGPSPGRRRTVAPINEQTMTALIEQQTRPFLRAVNELKNCNDSLSQKIGTIVDRIAGLESQVMLLSEKMRETARAQEESMNRPRAGAVTSANGMQFLKEFEHAGRTNLKNRFREKIKKFCLSRGGRMYFGSERCKELVTGKSAIYPLS